MHMSIVLSANTAAYILERMSILLVEIENHENEFPAGTAHQTHIKVITALLQYVSIIAMTE